MLLNNNMRCFEIADYVQMVIDWEWLNNNMRCFEIVAMIDMTGSQIS